MMRILGLVTIALVMAAGCSEPSNSVDNAKSSPSDGPTAVQPDRRHRDAKILAKTPAATPDDLPLPSGRTEEAAADAAPTESRVESEVPAAARDVETDAAVLELLEQMASDATIERRAASEALDELGEAGMPSIVLGLRTGSKTQKRGAATYLVGRVSPRDAETVPALIDALATDDKVLRHAALQAVEKVSPEQLAQALPALIQFAQDSTEEAVYRSRAIRAITKLQRQGESATTELIQLARAEPSVSVRRACFFAIFKVAPKQAAEQFFQEQLKDDKTADLRRLAAKWLARVVRTDQSLACLVDALNDTDESVRLQAVDSLVAVGKPALPVLIKALESSDVETRRHATLAIGKLGLLAASAIPALKARLDDSDQQVRELAKAALKKR